jgi:hypothetical protein
MDTAQDRGWAVVKGDELHGMIFFHGGDDSKFVAKRAITSRARGSEAMRKLEFTGKVQADATPQLVIPGRDELFLKPDDWPTQLARGTLRMQVDANPEGVEGVSSSDSLKMLDEGKFRPALVIPQRKIIGSTLMPDSDHPTRGFAQVWQADLQVIGTGQEATCWALRIIGADNPSLIDLVDQENLRRHFNLGDGAAVKVTVWEAEAKWKPPTPTEIIVDWCQAAQSVEEDYGREKAMGYLIGEKFLNFLERAETDREWREAIPAFVAEIKGILEPWQLAEFLNTPRRLGALGHASSEEGHRLLREEWTEEERLRDDARNLRLLEWAKE